MGLHGLAGAGAAAPPDGDVIDAYITLAWDPIRSPRILKRFRAASVEMQGSYYAEIAFGYQLGYGTTELLQPSSVAYASGFQCSS